MHYRNYIFHQATALIFPKHSSCCVRVFCFFFSLSVRRAWLLKNTQRVSYQNLMRNAASDCTWGVFKRHRPCRCLAKYSANSPARNVQRMSAKLATDAEFLARKVREREKCLFLSCSVPGKPQNFKSLFI